MKTIRTPGSANERDTLSTQTLLIGEKFEETQNNLKTVILTEVTKNNKQLEEKINEAVQMNKSYADTVTNMMSNEGIGVRAVPVVTNIDFRTEMREERSKQLADETDNQMRTSNFIVHGNVTANGEIPERKQHENF